MSYIDPYTISIAVAQFMQPPLIFKRDIKEFAEKVRSESKKVNEPNKGSLLDTYA
jgi:hypothetical protein